MERILKTINEELQILGQEHHDSIVDQAWEDMMMEYWQHEMDRWGAYSYE